MDSTGDSPSSVRRSTTSSARRSEPGCRPWSTVMPPARMPSLGASKARAEASAIESAPPEHATSTSGVDGCSCGAGAGRSGAGERLVPGAGTRSEAGGRATSAAGVRLVSGAGVCSVRMSWSTRRTARRIAATAGWGPMSGSLHEVFGGEPGSGHSECVDGDRTGPFPEHCTPTHAPRSLGRVIGGAFTCRRPDSLHDPPAAFTTLPCGAPARPSPPVWRSPSWSGACSGRSTPG